MILMFEDTKTKGCNAMSIDKEKKYEQIELMSKEEAVREIEKFFKGNKKFIEQASIIIYSSHNFQKISSMKIIRDNWNWEKLLQLTLDTEFGFKHFCYRKGNKKYGYRPENEENERRYNQTSEIEDFILTIYHKETQNVEEYTFS